MRVYAPAADKEKRRKYIFERSLDSFFVYVANIDVNISRGAFYVCSKNPCFHSHLCIVYVNAEHLITWESFMKALVDRIFATPRPPPLLGKKVEYYLTHK